MDDAYFVAAIQAQPGDVTHRLVYADWLEERGHVNAAAAIRSRMEAEQSTLFSSLWATIEVPFSLSRAEIDAWAARIYPEAELPAGWEFITWRGVPCGVRLTPDRMSMEIPSGSFEALARWPGAERLVAMHVARRIFDRTAAERLAEGPWMPALRALWLPANAGREEFLQLLVRRPNMAGLYELVLFRTPVFGSGASAIASSPFLANLRRLNVAQARLGDSGLAAIADSQSLSQLESLDLTANSITPQGFDFLARSRSLQGLTSLSLSHNQLDGTVLHWLAQSPALDTVRVLDLGLTHLPEAAIAGFCRRAPESITHLSLARNPFARDDAAALAGADFTPKLVNLNLYQCQLGDAGLSALAAVRCPKLAALSLEENRLWKSLGTLCDWELAELRRLAIGFNRSFLRDDNHVAKLARPRLQYLDLHSTALSSEGLRQLLEAGALQQLVHLDLTDNRLGNRGIIATAASAAQATLESLGAGHVEMGKRGLRALVETKLPRLRTLVLNHNTFGHGVGEWITQAPWFATLETLHLRTCALTDNDLIRIQQAGAGKRLEMPGASFLGYQPSVHPIYQTRSIFSQPTRERALEGFCAEWRQEWM